ncbi:MAG: cupin domain-containing protein [Steroidobacteraceae bacterium]
MSHVIFSHGRRSLHAAPINRDWVVDGTPEARGCPIFETSDQGANVHEWQCTRGRFVWHYIVDEIVYIIEGDARIKDLATGLSTHITAGTSVLFQRGSSAEWTVDRHIRKIAINHVPLSPKAVLLRSAWRRLKRLFGKTEHAQDGGLSGLPLGDESPASHPP